MNITKELFGRLPTGEEMLCYTLTNKNNVSLTVLNYGGKMVNLWVPDKRGHHDDLLMGFDRPECYLVRNPYFGSLVGRYANRIRDAGFTLNGKEYHLDPNAAPHHLHGGSAGFDKCLWDAEPVSAEGESRLILTLFSPDGDQGYPGNLHAKVTYSLNDSNDLAIEYEAVCDQDTPFNPTNHAYFNLKGHQNGNILDHLVQIRADYITDLADDRITNGNLLPVAGTPFDFNTPRLIGERYQEPHRLLALSDGYDINYVLHRDSESQLEKVCNVSEETSGRSMTVSTTLPAMQFYTANYIKGNFTFTGKGGHFYPQYCGLCLETQYYPNSVNLPQFPSTILRKGEQFYAQTVYHLDF